MSRQPLPLVLLLALGTACAQNQSRSQAPGATQAHPPKAAAQSGTPAPTAATTGAATPPATTASSATEPATAAQAPSGDPSVQIGEPSLSGQLANATQPTLELQKDFLGCYESGLGQDAKAGGTLLVALQVGKDGGVTRADASPIGNIPASVQSCIRERAEKAKYAAPKGGSAIVSFSVTLTRTAEAATQTARAGTSEELKEVAVSPPGYEHADKVAQFVRAKARECYRDALRIDPRAEGNVAVALWLNEKGIADKAEALRTGTLSDKITDCIKKRSVPAHFPLPKVAPTVVTVPMRLATKPAK